MSTHVRIISVKAESRFEAEKEAAIAATKAGQEVVMVGVPERNKDDQWNVPVTVLGEEKKSKKAKLKVVKESDKE